MTPHQIARFISEDLSFKAGIILAEDKELGEVLADMIEDSSFNSKIAKRKIIPLVANIIKQFKNIIKKFNLLEASEIDVDEDEYGGLSYEEMDVLFLSQEIHHIIEMMYTLIELLRTWDNEFEGLNSVYEALKYFYEKILNDATTNIRDDRDIRSSKVYMAMAVAFDDFYTTISPIIERIANYYNIELSKTDDIGES